MQNPYNYENSKRGKKLQNQMEIQENYMNHNQQKDQRKQFGHDEGVSNSYANLEIIGSNDEQQLCNANKMDLNQSFVFLVDFFIKKITFE